MAGKDKTYILIEIEWLEKKVKELMDLVDANSPFSEIPDRTQVEINAKGVPIIRVIAKKEDTIKVIKDVLKDLPSMFESLDRLREKRAEADIEVRGSSSMNRMMTKTLGEKET